MPSLSFTCMFALHFLFNGARNCSRWTSRCEPSSVIVDDLSYMLRLRALLCFCNHSLRKTGAITKLRCCSAKRSFITQHGTMHKVTLANDGLFCSFSTSDGWTLRVSYEYMTKCNYISQTWSVLAAPNPCYIPIQVAIRKTCTFATLTLLRTWHVRTQSRVQELIEVRSPVLLFLS